jgi:uncharacterized protein YjbI with pentapeptide repeats
MGRKISMAALREIQEEHDRWVSTVGSEGRCANLSEVNLSGIKLYNVNLNHVNLSGADLRSANLSEVKLRGANLRGVKQKGANLRDASLTDTVLSSADLRGALGLTIEQLREAKTLYKSRLDPDLMKQVKEEYPRLLEKPNPEE